MSTTTVTAVGRIHVAAHSAVNRALNESLMARNPEFSNFLSDNEMLIDLPTQDVIAQFLGTKANASSKEFFDELHQLEKVAYDGQGWNRDELRRIMALTRLGHCTVGMGIVNNDHELLWRGIVVDLDLRQEGDVNAIRAALDQPSFDPSFAQYIRQQLDATPDSRS